MNLKTRRRRIGLAVAFLSLVGIGVVYGGRLLDQILVVLILALYLVGSAVLVFKSLGARPKERRRMFSCGELALLPESWRRWVLDERPPAVRHKL